MSIQVTFLSHLKFLTLNLQLTFIRKKTKYWIFPQIQSNGFSVRICVCVCVKSIKSWNGMKLRINVGSTQVPKVSWYPYEQIWWLNSTQLSLWLKLNLFLIKLISYFTVFKTQSSVHGLWFLKSPTSLRQCHTSSTSYIQTLSS